MKVVNKIVVLNNWYRDIFVVVVVVVGGVVVCYWICRVWPFEWLMRQASSVNDIFEHHKLLMALICYLLFVIMLNTKLNGSMFLSFNVFSCRSVFRTESEKIRDLCHCHHLALKAHWMATQRARSFDTLTNQ